MKLFNRKSLIVGLLLNIITLVCKKDDGSFSSPTTAKIAAERLHREAISALQKRGKKEGDFIRYKGPSEDKNILQIIEYNIPAGAVVQYTKRKKPQYEKDEEELIAQFRQDLDKKKVMVSDTSLEFPISEESLNQSLGERAQKMGLPSEYFDSIYYNKVFLKGRSCQPRNKHERKLQHFDF
jgi:hypothetical protein